jgi:hypothetical protein
VKEADTNYQLQHTYQLQATDYKIRATNYNTYLIEEQLLIWHLNAPLLMYIVCSENLIHMYICMYVCMYAKDATKRAMEVKRVQITALHDTQMQRRDSTVMITRSFVIRNCAL